MSEGTEFCYCTCIRKWFWHCITLSFTVLLMTEGLITQEKCFTLRKLRGLIDPHA